MRETHAVREKHADILSQRQETTVVLSSLLKGIRTITPRNASMKTQRSYRIISRFEWPYWKGTISNAPP